MSLTSSCASRLSSVHLSVGALAAITSLAAPTPSAQGGCGGWVVVPSPDPGLTSNSLSGVAADSEWDAWAIGLAKTKSDGTTALALHWNGSAWSETPLPDVSGLGNALAVYAVDADPAGTAWIAGTVSASVWTTLQVLLRWNGAGFDVAGALELAPQPVYPFAPRFGTVEGTRAIALDDLWSVGVASGYGAGHATSLGLALHWDGSQLTEVAVPAVGNRTNYLYAVDGESSDDVWAVGHWRNVAGAYHGLIQHFDGAEWSHVPSTLESIPQTFLLDVAAIAPDDVWAVGEQPGGALFLHFDGESWTIAPSPVDVTTRIRQVAAIASDDVWAVAAFSQDLYHYDGTSWSPAGNPLVPDATGVNRSGGLAAVGPCDVWSVGSAYAGPVPSTLVERLNGAWAALGHGLSGSAGVPVLAGLGSLQAGTPFSLSLSSAAGNAFAAHVAGLSTIDLPLLGGVLVPTPAHVHSLTTDAAGGASVTFPWPSSLATGQSLFVQSWILDAGGAQGFAASHALSATQP